MRGPCPDRWLIYALGGGLGHLTRALALARAAWRRGHSIRLLTNSPFVNALPIEGELGPAGTVPRIDPTLDRHAVALVIRAALDMRDFDAFVVDTFPRGLGGELAGLLEKLDCPKVLIHRDLDPSYVRWADLRAYAAHFDCLLLPGEDAPLGDLPHARRTAPWLVRDAAELLDRPAARRRLGLKENDARPVVVVTACGRREEIEVAHARAARLDAFLAGAAAIRCASVVGPGLFLWPLLEVMPGIDVLVGAGGYNTVHEARAPARRLSPSRSPAVMIASITA